MRKNEFTYCSIQQRSGASSAYLYVKRGQRGLDNPLWSNFDKIDPGFKAYRLTVDQKVILTTTVVACLDSAFPVLFSFSSLRIFIVFRTSNLLTGSLEQ